jgi:cytoskeletal protein CcmA (bactofilin family)
MADKRAAEAALTLISATTVVEGKIQTEGSVRIDGTLVGDLVAKASAAVGLTGSVEGSIQARNVSLSGKLKGSVTAAEKLVLEKKSVVSGDIRAARLVVDEGAVFDGTCVMSQAGGGSGSSASH